MTERGKNIKVLVGKPGLDGHDVGAKVIVRTLMEAGFDVVYTGLKKTPQEIVQRAVEEKVDVLGLSILSGSHIPICTQFKALLREHELSEVVWIVGGNIPANIMSVKHIFDVYHDYYSSYPKKFIRKFCIRCNLICLIC